MRYLRTNKIVGDKIRRQGQQLQEQAETGDVKKLLVLRDWAGSQEKGTRSYTAQLKTGMGRVLFAASAGVREYVRIDDLIQVRTAGAADLKHIARDADADPKIRKVLVMSPTQRSYEEIVAELSAEKDVDGMNPNSGIMPCTPVAIQEVLEKYDLWNPDFAFGLIGFSRTVNLPLGQMIRKLLGDRSEEQMHIVTRSNAEKLESFMAVSDVAIVAAGVHHQITAGMVPDRMRAVVGVCIDDIDPSVYQIDRSDLLVTPEHLDVRHWGIGANTVANTIQRTFDS